MPFRCSSYMICPGDRLEVEVVQPDGGRALVVGKLDAVPAAAGGCALRIEVGAAQITVLPRPVVQGAPAPVGPSSCAPSNDPLARDGHRMTGENAETVPLPVANCVLCRWPMDGTVNILEVQIGTAVYRACAEECPPAGVDRRRYLDERHAEARRVEREIGKIDRRIIGAAHSMADFNRWLDLERRHSRLRGLSAPRRVHEDPSSAAGHSAAEVVRRVRELLRSEGGEA